MLSGILCRLLHLTQEVFPEYVLLPHLSPTVPQRKCGKTHKQQVVSLNQFSFLQIGLRSENFSQLLSLNRAGRANYQRFALSSDNSQNFAFINCRIIWHGLQPMLNFFHQFCY